MKHSLLSLALAASLLSFNQSKAQCTVSAPVLSNVVSTGCSYTFDLSFKLTGNGGNKVTALYIFNGATYSTLPSNFYGSNSNGVPSSSQINAAGTLATIKINSDSAATVFNYQKSGQTVERPTSMKGGLTYTIDAATGQVTIKGIQLTVPNCGSQVTLQADVLSSQSPDLSSVGCLAKGAQGLSFSPTDVAVRASNNGCGTSRTVTATFITSAPATLSFRLYRDVAPFGQFTAADTAAGNAVSTTYTATTQAAPATGDYRSVGNYAYTVVNGERFDVWVVVPKTADLQNASVALATNTCAPLPVKLNAFSAQRSRQSVLLNWETATEMNNRGFNIQRQVGNEEWKNVGYVATKALNGNSNASLSYSFSDVGALNAVTQYRLQQVDADGKLTYSDVRTVRGDENGSKLLVYPNPSADGKVNLLFDGSAGTRDVIVSNVAGGVVKRIAGVSNNTVVIDNLKQGFYTVQVSNRSTGSVTIEKFVIK